MAIKPPTKKNSADNQQSRVHVEDEARMEEVISKGGGLTNNPPAEKPKIKSLTVRIMSDRLDVLNQLRDERPKSAFSKRPGVSLENWLMEAIEEKIERDQQ